MKKDTMDAYLEKYPATSDRLLGSSGGVRP